MAWIEWRDPVRGHNPTLSRGLEDTIQQLEKYKICDLILYDNYTLSDPIFISNHNPLTLILSIQETRAIAHLGHRKICYLAGCLFGHDMNSVICAVQDVNAC
jgi:hypothetical protein